MFLSIDVFSFIPSSVRPGFYSCSFLFVIDPFAYVLSAILVDVIANTMSLVIYPFTFIDIPISVYETPITIGLRSFPVSNIHGPICPMLRALTMLLALSVKEPIIHGTVFQLDRWPLYQSNIRFLVSIIHKWWKFFSRRCCQMIAEIWHPVQLTNLR